MSEEIIRAKGILDGMNSWRQEVMKRTCFYIPVEQFDENGYIPSVVTEGEPGHAPCKGRGAFSQPWYWGKTYEEAQARCTAENEAIGISFTDALEIVLGSMAMQGFGRRK